MACFLAFQYVHLYYLSPVVRKPDFCICENKDADQLRCNREADQRLCFHYTDSTTPLLPKSEISSLKLSSVAVLPGLCRTLSETPKTGFLKTRLICLSYCISAAFKSSSSHNLMSAYCQNACFSFGKIYCKPSFVTFDDCTEYVVKYMYMYFTCTY